MDKDDPPALGPDPQTITATAQLLHLAAPRIARALAEARESLGRLAYSDDEHSELAHLARQVPPLRPMTEAESDAWTELVPRHLASQVEDEPFTVWSQPLPGGKGGWGLESHIYHSDGREIRGLLLVVRDGEDAEELQRWLQDNHTPEDFDLLAKFAQNAVANAPDLPGDSAAVLDVESWSQALSRHLRDDLAERMAECRDPRHQHHGSWMELHKLASEEVRRVDADPERLAELISNALNSARRVDAPPSLGYYVLNEARTDTRYVDSVRRAAGTDSDTEPASGSEEATTVDGEVVAAESPTPSPPALPTSEAEALRYVANLLSGNATHHIAAKQVYGKWGSRVDAKLAAKFPHMTGEIRKTAKEEQARKREAADAVAAVVTGDDVGMPAEDDIVQKARDQAATVANLLLSKPNHRVAARVMVSRALPPTVALIARKFCVEPEVADEEIAAEIERHYPDEADAWLGRSTAAGVRAATGLAETDLPQTPQDERTQALGGAGRELSVAEAAAAYANDAARAAAARARARRP